jgi:transposase
MAREAASLVHAEPSRHYREVASAIRHRLPAIQDEEIYSELYLLAAHYERLAEFADSSGPLASVE